MKTNFYKLSLVLALFFLYSLAVCAQNNLNISFKDAVSAPQNLSICGDPYEVTIKVNLSNNSIDNLKAITADVKLFKGIQLVSFNSDKSSVGVTLKSNDPVNPQFGLPDMSKNALQEVFITYSIIADCDYLDTLALNDKLNVKDTWNFNYSNNNNLSLFETDYSTEYRDALKLPFLSIDVLNKNSKQNVGQNFQRIIQVTNGGLAGYLKNFTYTNVQGAGVWIKSIQVNNVSVPLTKSVTLSNDTLITIQIAGNLFAGNTIGQGGPGNGNNLFDPDELVSITETGTVAACIKSKQSIHSAEWGCFSKLCSKVQDADEIQIPQGQIFVDFNKGGLIPDENAGYCKTGKSTVTLKNTGVEVDPGTANMYNVSAGIGLGNSFTLSDGGFKITSVKISGKNIPNNQLSTSVDLNNNPLFKTDPDGSGGLSDLDGDGYFDDLPRNESISVEILYDVDCLNGNNIPIKGACINNITTSFIAKLDYSNFCGDRISFKSDPYFIPVNILDSYQNCSDPDAYTDGTTFFVSHEEIRNVFNFEKQCNGGEQLIVTVILPKGITPSINEISLTRLSQVFPLLNHTQSGDTLRLFFDASVITFLNGVYKINLALKANCEAKIGQSVIPVIFEHLCPTCNCKHTFYCENITGPVIHYSAPPCNFNAAYECKEGLNTLSFDAVRTTLGFTDKNYTNKIDASKANTHAAISCDSIRLTVKSVVGKSSISDSIGVKIQYSNVDKSKSVIETLIFDKGTLRITHGGQTFNLNVSKANLNVQSIDSLKLLTFNLHNQLTSLGITLVENDKVDFIGDFYLNPDGPFTTTFNKIPNFRAYSYALVNGEVKRCDDNGETFEIAKTKTGFIYPTNSTFPKGCQETFLEYALIQVNNGYNDIFPGEFRAASKVDSLTFDFDPKILSAYTLFQPEVSIPGHPIFGNNFFPVNGFTSSGKYKVRFDTLSYVPPLNTVGSKAFIFRFKVIPDCKSEFGSNNGNNTFNFDPTLYYQARYHAKVIGNGSCVQKSADYVDDDIVYNEPPKLSYILDSQNNTSGNSEISWRVKLCNTSEIGDAGITWFSLNAASDAVYDVLSVKDITDPGNPKNLSFKKYGPNNSNTFVFSDGLTNTQGGNASQNDLCNLIEFKIKLIKCGSSGFSSDAGWNCTVYSDPNWTPLLYTPCQSLKIPLPVDSEVPQLDGNFVNQNLDGEEICDETTLELLVRNTDQGVATGIKTQFTIPLQGAEFIPGSVEVAYPSNSSFVKALQNPVFNGVDAKGQVFVYDDLSKLNTTLAQNGLAGFNPQNPNTNNEFRLKFKFKTNCDFVSGSLAYHSIFGKSSCGDFTKVDEGESLPLIIKGLTTNSFPKLFNVSIDPSAKIIPGGQTKIKLIVTNLENTPTDNFDKILLTIPQGLSYISGTSVSINPISWIPGNPQILSSGGNSILKWMMPAGLGKNQTIILELTLNSENIDCTDLLKDFALETVAERILECKSNNTVCDNSFSSSQNGKNIFKIPVMKPVITVTSSTPNVTCTGDPIKLTASGGITYTWLNVNTGQNLGGGESIFVNPVTVTTYQVTGGFGNCQSSATISLQTIIDKNPPVLTGIPADVTAECDAVIPIGNPKATDDCDQNVEITFKETMQVIDKCTKKITRTWTAKDDLGNISTAQQMITLIDTKAPVISFVHPLIAGKSDGDTITVNCGEMPVLGAADAIVNDNCDANPDVEFIDYGIVQADCKKDGYFILMICSWEAKDDCGNTSKIKLYFKIIDNLPPVLSGVPADIIINHNDPVPPVAVVTAKDLCDSDVPVKFTESMVMVGCQTIIVRTWEAEDDCMNKVSASQTIKIKCDPCILPEIISAGIINATCSAYGSINVNVKDAQNYEYLWVPELGKSNALGNIKTELYPGSYNLIISSKKSQNCYKKLTFNILQSGSCKDTLYVKGPNDLSVDTCLTALIDINKITSATIIKSNPATASLSIKTDQKCVKIIPNPAFTGTDILSLVHCDQNICDTTFIKVEFYKNKTSLCNDYIAESKLVLKTSDCTYGAELCLEIPFADINQYKITDHNVLFKGLTEECNTFNVKNTKLILPKGNHHLVFESAEGCKDSMDVKVTCHTITNIDKNLYIGEMGQLSLDMTSLAGEKVSVSKLYASDNNTIVDFIVRPKEGLISYHGKSPGISKSAFIYTAEDGSSEKIEFSIKVESDLISNQVQMLDHHFKTNKNESLLINVSGASGVIHSETGVLIINVQPENGEIITGGNNVIQYFPADDYCGVDQFSYVYCNYGTCMYSNVFVEVYCEDLTVYNGVTPNNDGLNDYFVIEGAQKYEGNSLRIFNRWGQEVFYAKSYSNNWDGSVNNKILPDGTYFYIFDNGAGFIKKGYIYLQR